MAVSTGNAANHDDFFDKLRTFLKAANPTGPAWTELAYEGGNPKRMLLKAPGLSGTEEIFIGFKKYEDAPGDTFGIWGWMAAAYDAGLDMEAQPNISPLRFMPLWDTTTPYWFYANGQRVIMVAKISTTYWASYLGKFLQYGTSGEYGLPFYLGMPHSAAVRYSTISESVRNFFDPGPGQILLPSGAWRQVSNFYESNGETLDTSSVHVWPYATEYSEVRDRFRELRDNVDGSYTTFPLTLLGNDPSDDIYGELDGAYAVSGFSTASEDTLTIGADTLRIFQNGFRTARQYYCAIVEA